MTPFTQHTGIVATLDRANVDTDAIIPKQFLKSIKRTGYGPNAFFDWRYGPDGTPDAGFELNEPRFEGRSILVTRNNFGCGSSREQAATALQAKGISLVLAGNGLILLSALVAGGQTMNPSTQQIVEAFQVLSHLGKGADDDHHNQLGRDQLAER